MSRRCVACLQPKAPLTSLPPETALLPGVLFEGTPEGTVPVAHTGPFHGTYWRRGAEAVNAGSGKPLQCCVEERASRQEDRHRLQLEGELTVPLSLIFSLYVCTYCGWFAHSSLCSLMSCVQGEGLIPGGILVVRSGTGGVVYAHQEQTFGDHAPIAEVRVMLLSGHCII
jgi:hypothetical protein